MRTAAAFNSHAIKKNQKELFRMPKNGAAQKNGRYSVVYFYNKNNSKSMQRAKCAFIYNFTEEFL